MQYAQELVDKIYDLSQKAKNKRNARSIIYEEYNATKKNWKKLAEADNRYGELWITCRREFKIFEGKTKPHNEIFVIQKNNKNVGFVYTVQMAEAIRSYISHDYDYLEGVEY